jgi:hypothetical protein
LANGTTSTDAVAFGQLAVLLPTGIITMWSGSIASIPAGWYLCNGANGTPDLRSRFIVGAGSTYAVNATGGSADATLVSHTHTFSGTTGGQSVSHTHGISDPGHTHSNNTIVGTGGAGSALSVADPASNEFPTSRISTNGSFTGITGTGSASNDHNHGYSGTTSTSGNSATNANLPPYLALAYIMKA